MLNGHYTLNYVNVALCNVISPLVYEALGNGRALFKSPSLLSYILLIYMMGFDIKIIHHVVIIIMLAFP